VDLFLCLVYELIIIKYNFLFVIITDQDKNFTCFYQNITNF